MEQPLDQYQHTSPTTAQVAHRPTLEGWRGEPPSCGPTHTSPLTEWQLDRRTPWVSSYCCGNQSRPGTFRGKATLPPLGPPALYSLVAVSLDRVNILFQKLHPTIKQYYSLFWKDITGEKKTSPNIMGLQRLGELQNPTMVRFKRAPIFWWKYHFHSFLVVEAPDIFTLHR